uniref:IML7 n=1 Tax=Mythimna separata TaxID=271217 RepID=A0A8F3C7C3_MYTSE|nr:IML7 [Mythimna separata]
MDSKTLLVFLVVCFLSEFSYGQRDKKFFRKDYTYIESEQSFYKVHLVANTFNEAKRICALEGSMLFYAEDVKEFKAVASFWQRTQPHIPWVFVGLSDQMSEGIFETVDRRPMSEVYNNWQRNQPSDELNNEDCVHMDLIGTMNDYRCDSKTKFICKKTLQSLEWNNNCNMSNSDYIYNQDIGKCYKLHTTPMNWTDAYAACRIESTSLALINNRMEADYLAKLTENTPEPLVSEQYLQGVYHVGFHNRFLEGWQTVEGTPMNVDAELWFNNKLPQNHYEEC